MKKLLSLLLCIVMTAVLSAGCAGRVQSAAFDREKIAAETVEGNSRFAFDIFRQVNVEEPDESVFISPLSISAALTMTYQGARTSTREAMSKTLGYTGIDDEKVNESYKNLLPHLEQLDKKVELNIANSLWIREGQDIEEAFLEVNRDVFNASVTPLDFAKAGAADEINQWISIATKNKIDRMVDAPIPGNVVMYLINAIYFKGDWTKQFDAKDSFSTQFFKEDGGVDEITMMSRSGKTEYGQGDGFKAVRLPYGSEKTAMYCILPEKATGVNDFINDLDADLWNTIRQSISEEDTVRLQLPRFKLEYGIKNLNDSLTALGMGEAFSETADFSGIRGGINISRVLHKAVIEVDEKGSEAAAATVVEMRETAAAEPLTFIADRPFVFLITDDETGTILFMGKLSGVK